MKKLVLLAVLAGLASCDVPQGDGYTFEKKEWEAKKLTITIVEHPNLKDLQDAGPKVSADHDLQAWSKVNKGGVCEIHIVNPKVRYDPAFLGHEVAHCAYGRFHK